MAVAAAGGPLAETLALSLLSRSWSPASPFPSKLSPYCRFTSRSSTSRSATSGALVAAVAIPVAVRSPDGPAVAERASFCCTPYAYGVTGCWAATVWMR